MNNPIFNDTIKIFDNLKNKDGKYSVKNQYFVDTLTKCLKLSIGCNFVVSLEFGDDKAVNTSNGFMSYHQTKDIIKFNELSNILMCLNVTMTDRIFYLSMNKNNQPMITCVHSKWMPSTIFVRDKDYESQSTIDCKSCFDDTVTKIVTKTSKGKRKINESEISSLRTAFNTMLGHNYNKELVKKVA